MPLDTEGSLLLEKCVADYSPEAVTEVTGIAAADIWQLAHDFMTLMAVYMERSCDAQAVIMVSLPYHLTLYS